MRGRRKQRKVELDSSGPTARIRSTQKETGNLWRNVVNDCHRRRACRQPMLLQTRRTNDGEAKGGQPTCTITKQPTNCMNKPGFSYMKSSHGGWVVRLAL